MERYEGNQQEYRKVSYVDGDDIKYSIEKKKGDKWVFCFGALSCEGANYLLNNPSQIEHQIKSFRISGYVILAFFVFGIIYLITQ